MKNLMQKLVKATLCVGVVSVSLIACESDSTVDKTVIDLDQIDDQIFDLDSLAADSTTLDTVIEFEPVGQGVIPEEETTLED